MLNGYSRMEYEKKTGTNAFSIMLFDENGLDKDIKRDTGLQKLPLKTQEMIIIMMNGMLSQEWE